MSFDSITNRGEFFSNHYLDAIIGGDLGDLRRTWDEQEKAHQDSARSRLKALSKPFFVARADVTEASSDANARRAIESLNGHVLLALGLKVDRQVLALSHTTTDELRVPVAATVETGSGLHLVALDAGLADDVDDLFATGAGEQGRLLDPVHKVGEKLEVVDPADAVSALFAVDDPPRWVLVVAGRTVLLAERARWAEGRFLAVDLDTALERNDTSVKGEIETIAALFSTDALVPHDGQAVIDVLADKSAKHAVGVSKELREGIRQSIELLANEVIRRRLDKNLGVYSGDNRIDPRELTTQCLRYLYRLLVLLYAESRPELGIVPVDDEVYMAGYSLDRLRELTLTELDTDKARHGTHLDQSLRSLFELVNEGYHADHASVGMLFDVDRDDSDASYEDYLQFPGLDAQLYDPSAVPLIDSVTLRNAPLQKVLQLLMLSPEVTGKRAERGFISYAQLGINQLGAVYEGLMAYTGFFADTDLYEVAKNGDPSDGTWVLPVEKADEYPGDVFVTREDPLTGAKARVLHPKGSFVFRLSGRDRQRSASYYTPEVLTRCVVKHALAELLGTDDYAPENGSSGIDEARQILDLTICEPALGSGAFLNEAINQLSAEYLKRRQAELGETLDPETYNRELQKVKAHFALHQSYGVDLNATAVELAEVSLWLNCMHPGLKAPWFGMQLRRGNSLVGCRRATWKASQLKDKPWAKTKKDDFQPPVDRPLTEQLADDEIHHFLLPSYGWAAVADQRAAKELRGGAATRLSNWRAEMVRGPKQYDADRLTALGRAVERHWESARHRLKVAKKALERPLELWGVDRHAKGSGSRADVEAVLGHPDSSLSRLRLLMDAWIGFWFLSPSDVEHLPDWGEWLEALEMLLQVDRPRLIKQLDLLSDLSDILESDEEREAGAVDTVAELKAKYPWLDQAQAAARRHGALHWELEFATQFERGGFDLLFGNPPWTKLYRSDRGYAEDLNPSWGLGSSPSDAEELAFISSQDDSVVDGYLVETVSSAGTSAFLHSKQYYPVATESVLNLYCLFMERTWQLRRHFVGLIHPIGHMTGAWGAELRRAALDRLRSYYQFQNELGLFEDVNNPTTFAVAVYGAEQARAKFRSMSWLFSPSTLEDSLSHDGIGPLPGIKDDRGRWDERPHRERLIDVTEQDLVAYRDLWGAALGDSTDAAPGVPRLVHSEDEAVALSLAGAGERLTELISATSSGLHEKKAKDDGIICKQVHTPGESRPPILQGAHLTVANVFGARPNVGCRHNRDWSPVALSSLSRSAIPRSNYRTDADSAELAAHSGHGTGLERRVHVVARRMLDPSAERTLQAAIAPPDYFHIHACEGFGTRSDVDVAVLHGVLAALPFDYLLKTAGVTDLDPVLLGGFPLPELSVARSPLVLRSARLACLTEDYARFWNSLLEGLPKEDAWIVPARQELRRNGHWDPSVGLRTDQDRRAALVELDALVSIGLGLSSDQLVTMYRTQFAVLRKYESAMVFDSNGHKICRFHQAAGARQTQFQQLAKDGRLPKEWKSVWALYEQWEADPDSVDWMGHYTPPFYRPDREAEMTAAFDEFQRRLESGFYDQVSEGASA